MLDCLRGLQELRWLQAGPDGTDEIEKIRLGNAAPRARFVPRRFAQKSDGILSVE